MAEENNNGNSLLGKKVNLLYLIFIILAFLYIPADFVDIFKGINEFYETNKNDNEKLVLYNSRIINTFDQSDPNVNKLQEDSRIINNSANRLISRIENYKNELVQNAGGINEAGYINRGKNYQLTKKYLADTYFIDSIKQGLKEHADILKTISGNDFYSKIDSTLYQGEFIASDGYNKDFNKFFFHEVPVSAAAAILTRIESNVLELSNQILGDRLERIFSENEFLRFGIQSDMLDNLYSSKNFGYYPAGEEIIFKVDYLELDQAIGFQNFDIYDRNRTNTVESLYIPKPVLELETPPILYAGVNNRITIKEDEFPGYSLETELSRGEVRKTGGNYYIRAETPGNTELKIYGTIYGRKILLAQQTFLIQDAPRPVPLVGERFTGTISEKIFKLQSGIKLEYPTDNLPEFNIKTFKTKRISSNISEETDNRGAFFNSGTRSLIDQARRGDIYLFDNIIAEDFNGKEVKLGVVVLTIN